MNNAQVSVSLVDDQKHRTMSFWNFALSSSLVNSAPSQRFTPAAVP